MSDIERIDWWDKERNSFVWINYEEWLFYKYFHGNKNEIPKEYLEKFDKITNR